jgi:MFS family permease
LALGQQDFYKIVRRTPFDPSAGCRHYNYRVRPARVPHRNFLLHTLNGVLVAISETLNDPTLIMTALLSQLTTSNLLIGILAPLRDTGWFLPQLFISHRVQRVPRKIVFYRGATAFRVAGWVLLVIALFTLSDHTAMLWAILVTSLIISVSGGIGGLSYVIVTAKAIAAHERGKLFGLREFLGGGLSVLMGGVGALILSGHFLGLELAFPHNYGLLFAVSTLFFAAGTFTFGLLHEEPDAPHTNDVRLRDQLRRAVGILRSHLHFRKFILMRAVLLFARAGMPFITVFAKRSLHISDGFLATLVSVSLGCALLAGLFWGRLNDRRGAAAVLSFSAVFGAAACAIALALTFLAPAVPLLGAPLLVACAMLMGVANAGQNVSLMALMIDVAPADERPLFFGLNNTILGIVQLLTSAVGLLADALGFYALFAFCGLCFLAMLTLVRSIGR